MDLATLKSSLSADMPPAGLSSALRSLWWDAKGDWEKAHVEVQDGEDRASCRVHAYLHRKEGDLSNARYWYRRGGAELPESTLDQEWQALVTTFLTGEG